jgi:hypothetical protein
MSAPSLCCITEDFISKYFGINFPKKKKFKMFHMPLDSLRMQTWDGLFFYISICSKHKSYTDTFLSFCFFPRKVTTVQDSTCVHKHHHSHPYKFYEYHLNHCKGPELVFIELILQILYWILLFTVASLYWVYPLM